MYPDKLGDFIASEREKFFPSRRVFASKIGLDPGTVGSIENGDTKSPGLEAIIAIARGLKVSPMKLIAVYEGKSPEKVESEGVLATKNLLRTIFQSLPEEIDLDDLLLEIILSRKGEGKLRELFKDVLERAEKND